MAEDKKGKVVLALIKDDGHVIVIKRRIPQAPLVWALPGGVVEEGETEIQALEREMKIELGIDVEVGEKFHERTHPDTFVNLAYYYCRAKSTELTIGEPEEIEEARWVTPEEALSLFTSNVAPELRKALLNQ